MSSKEDSKSLAARLPLLEDDPIERRRVLNILAQRRHRIRKRARVQELEAQVAAKAGNHGGDSCVLHQRDNWTRNSNSSISECSVLQPSEAQRIHNDSTQGGFIFQGHLSEVAYENHVGSFQNSSSGNSLDFPATAGAENDFNLIEGPECPIDFQYNYRPALDFADYAITTPGLSVIRAHTIIFRHMHGPGYDLDIWNPWSISPISLGFEIQPSPKEFQPSPLQRRVQHHPIIDVLPWLSFRDRFLYVMSLPKELRPKIAQNDMASVTLELMFAIKDAGGGLRVWGANPFSPDSWEIGQTFYTKFWWAIDRDIVEKSNQHRERRAENRLRLDVLDTV